MSKDLSRRGFLGIGAAVGAIVAGGSVVGCAPRTKGEDVDSSTTDAGGYSFMKDPGPIAESDITSEEIYDIVVVGGSATGLAAAASAAEDGATVVCIEKASKALGAGTYYGFINTDFLAEHGVPNVDEDAYYHALVEAALGACDPELVRIVVRNSSHVGNWMAELSAETGVSELFSNDMGSENTVLFDDGSGNGASVYDMLTQYGSSHGGEYAYSTEVVRIEKEGDRVTGVIAKAKDGSYTRYKANSGVVLATGAYNGDPEMIQCYIPWVDNDALVQKSPIALTGNTGDGLKMALWVGGQVGAAPHCPMIHFIEGTIPMAGSLFVNRDGRRFMDEGTSMEVAAQILMRQPGKTMYQIADAKPSGIALSMASMGAGVPSDSPAGGEGESDAAAEAGAVVRDGASSDVSTGGGPAAEIAASASDPENQFDSLEDMAHAKGFDLEVLKATVDRWNELVASGIDSDFGSDFAIAQTIDTPPYTCIHTPGCALAMIGGPRINYRMQVLDTEFKPIEGLYAGGNCTTGFYGPNYPMQIQEGIARAFCTISGYLASKNALGK